MEHWQISTILAFDNAFVVILLVGTIAATIWTYVTLDPSWPFRSRGNLVLVRLTTLLLAIYLFMQPSLILTRSEQQPANLAIVVDGSLSMSFPMNNPRFQSAISALKKNIPSLKKNKDRTLHFYSFAQRPQSHQKIENIQLHSAPHNNSNLSQLLNHLQSKQNKIPFAGVLLFSDGAFTSAVSPSSYRSLQIPINTVFISNTNIHKDIFIKKIHIDPFAFARKPNPIIVSIENHGIALTNVKVNLLQNGKLLQQKTANIIGGSGQVEFQVVPQTPGRHIYTVSIPEYTSDTYSENNIRHVEMNVIRDKYRVLHLSGSPTWDQRFTRQMLTEWPQIDLVSFYLLRTAYQSTTQSTSGLSLIPFPTDQLFTEHLNEFDILIFQDFDPATVGVDTHLNAITKFVTNGGALVLLGGPTGFTAPSIANSPLAKLLPVAFQKATAPTSKLIYDAPFSPILTEAGKNHPLLNISGPNDNMEELLHSLPRIPGILKVKQMNTAGVALLSHPTVQIADGPAPFIAVSEPGDGRILTVMTDSFWTWGYTAAMTGAPANFYTDFWKQAIQWLTKSPTLSRLTLDLERESNHSHTPITFNTNLLNQDYLPAAGETIETRISWLNNAEQPQTVEFSGITNNVGQYQLTWTPSSHGPHRIMVQSKGQQLELHDNFLVVSATEEINHLVAQMQPLRTISKETSGTFFVNELDTTKIKLSNTSKAKILSRKDFALWSHPVALIMLLGLLLSDWAIRRRLGLL